MSNSILANVLRASHKSTHLLGNSSSGAGTNDKAKVQHVHSIDKQIIAKARATHIKDAQDVRNIIDEAKDNK